MPTRESLITAVALGSAAMFGSMGGLLLMTGTLAGMAVRDTHWSEEMTAITNGGVSMMYTAGIVMVVLAVLCGVAGWVLGRRARQGASA